MSWHYLQGQAEACWDPNCLGGLPDALAKLMPTPDRFCLPGSETECSIVSLSGTTLEPSTEMCGTDQSTSYPADFRVKISPPPDEEPELLAVVRACGKNMRASLAKFGLSMFSPKIPQCLGHAGSTLSSRICGGSGMMQNGLCWALATSAPPPHARDRLWILATDPTRTGPSAGDLRDACRFTGVVGNPWLREEPKQAASRILGMANGMADRVGRIRCAGNGQVPLVARLAFIALAGL